MLSGGTTGAAPGSTTILLSTSAARGTPGVFSAADTVCSGAADIAEMAPGVSHDHHFGENTVSRGRPWRTLGSSPGSNQTTTPSRIEPPGIFPPRAMRP